MTDRKIPSLINYNWPFYLISFLILLGLKFFYSRAGSDELAWILIPTALWVRILSGISFEWVAGVGYVSHACRFIIAPSCSGVQFLIITAATLLYSFLHRMENRKSKVCWLFLSFTAAYLCTITVNGLRILLSIRLPLLLHPENSGGWLTPDRLHTITGVAVYLVSLLFIYRTADFLTWNGRRRDGKNRHRYLSSAVLTYLPPLFWYFFIVLGVPFLNSASQRDRAAYSEYARLIVLVCLIVTIPFLLVSAIRKRRNR